MGVPVGSIVAGKCHVTEIGQVRRVLEAKDGKVKYESRGQRPTAGRGRTVTTVSDVKFALPK
jgi:hypothetical protein